MFSIPFHLPFANAADHLIFTSHQLFAPTSQHLPSLSIQQHLSIVYRITAHRLTIYKCFRIFLSPTPRPRHHTVFPASRTRGIGTCRLSHGTWCLSCPFTMSPPYFHPLKQGNILSPSLPLRKKYVRFYNQNL
mgnify:CR=1 FL=1